MDLSRQLFDVIRDKNDAKISDLLEKMTAKEVNKKNPLGWTALHQACKRNNVFAVEKLLAFAGIDVNVRNNLGCTPLLMVFGKAAPSSFKYCASRIKKVLKLMMDDPRVELNAVSKDGNKLEDTFEKYKDKEAKQYLDIMKMIKDAKQGRENKLPKQKNENHGDITSKVKTDLEKMKTNIKTQYKARIETTNKEIETEEKKINENEVLRKGRINDMQEKQDLELRVVEKEFDQEIDKHQQKKLKLEQQLAEVQELMIKLKDKKEKTLEEMGIQHRSQSAVLYSEVKLESEEEQKKMTKLKELKNKLTKDLKRYSSDDHAYVEEARENLECPVCLESMKPPTRIWMCQSTHLICEPCKGKLPWLKVCPTCKTGSVTMRSLIMEKMARTLFPTGN